MLMLPLIFAIFFFPCFIKCNPIIIPLYGNVYEKGYYYAKVQIGSPRKQKQTLIIDTGSSFTGLSCKGCKNCGIHEFEPFDLDISETSNILKCKYNPKNEKINTLDGNVINSYLINTCICNKDGNCIYNVKYSEGSKISGYYIEDFIEFETEDFKKLIERSNYFKLVLGCHTTEEKLFKYQKASGIMGLADFKNIEDKTSVISNIFGKKSISNKLEQIISILLHQNNGKLIFGSTYYDQINNQDIKRNLHFLLRCKDDVRYCSYVSDISISNLKSEKSSNLEHQYLYKVVFDTGTTLSVFPSKLFNKIINSIFKSISKFYPNISSYNVKDGIVCWKISKNIEINVFPSITISFVKYSEKLYEIDYKKVSWSPSSYLYLHKSIDTLNNIYCLGMISDNMIDNLNFNKENNSKIHFFANQIILGTTFFIDKEITFYLNENKILIGEYDLEHEYLKDEVIDSLEIFNKSIKNIHQKQNKLELNRDVLEMFAKKNNNPEDFFFLSNFYKGENFAVNNESLKHNFIFTITLLLLFITLFSTIAVCWKFLKSFRSIRREVNDLFIEDLDYYENRQLSNTSKINIVDFINNVSSNNREKIDSSDRIKNKLNCKIPELLLPVLPIRNKKDENVCSVTF